VRLAALVTGGKDSALALYRALEDGYEVKCLVTMLPKREDSWMFHYPNVHLTNFFSEAIGIPLVKAETSGIKEDEVEDLKGVLSALNVDGVVHGAIASQYQKKRIDRICRELGLKSISPLWQEKPVELLKELVKLGFIAVITGVYAYGFDSSWLGRKIDAKTVGALIELNRKYEISLVGDGGEYETLILDAPYFKKEIRLLETEKNWENHNGYLLVKKAELKNKP
jgi:diphthine-ammonia ligase